MKKKRQKKPIIRPINDKCPYCVTNSIPHYRDHEDLAKYVTDRGKIMQKERSGLCTKHQKQLASAIKRARHLALLPYIGNVL